MADIRTPDGWSLSPARTENQVLLYSYILSLPLSLENDFPLWSIDGISQKLFSSKAVWNVIRNGLSVKPWASIIWHKATIPRHATTAWLFVLNRNPTLHRLTTWGLDIEPVCLLCGSFNESRDHIFFACSFSTSVWNSVTHALRIASPPVDWDAVLNWLPQIPGDKYLKLAILQGWQACIYEIWQERNRRFHSGLTLSPAKVCRMILDTVRTKCSALKALGSSLGLPLECSWLNHP